MTTLQENQIVIPVHRPAFREKLFFFISGTVSSIPLTLFVSQFTDLLVGPLPLLYAVLFSAVIFAPWIEEFAKAFPLFYRHGETERSIFILGFLVGLGFGIFEFFTYVFVLGVPFVFRLPAVFFHAASTSITAYGIATKRPVVFYLISVMLHFSNNFLAFVRFSVDPEVLIGPWSIGAYVVAVATYFLSWHLYDKTSERIVA